MNFEYMAKETEYLDSIDIEDFGNCALRATNDDYQEFYIEVRTELGWTTIRQFGGMHVDSNHPNSFTYMLYGMEFDERKVIKAIRDFLNDKRRGITQVFEIDPDEARERYSQIDLY